ncbi:coproporphyrinogen III oxidase [Thermosipho melanesiensis]|nr:coproporphyrinogen III oxidase [Thermosipho melanesiensis]OOC38471.1 coproporphyrinogen III oxidase [Thermosipho melanesiensis]OOC38933.1 coproporphyrinogen III oxidase [Thermosipho melanesiensis]OOC41571.1 coproporphyrinogen III oxidase [Thermosipho melanesiensis]OOC44060.1 coproporphyrinogen III oxidase [Thermosipho melanesiensis]
MGNLNKISLYIHIPFCKKKCYYCDFVSYTEGSVENYIEALITELKLYEKYLEKGIKTLYIGGGTPSYINEHYIEKLVMFLNKYLQLEEFTIEVNPDSFDSEKAYFYKSLGTNRISLGIQSLDDTVLKRAGRTHNSYQAYKAYEIAKGIFNNINVDFIIGLPGESWKSIEKIVDFIRLEHPKHISVYLLEIHEGTFLSKIMKKIPDESFERHDALLDFLKTEGYERYEISNFALNENYSKHNLVYWANREYIGVGLSAGGHFDNFRYNNVSDFKSYFLKLKNGKFPYGYQSKNTKEKEILETIFMMLRTKWGIDKKLVHINFEIENILNTLKRKFTFFDGTRLSEKGMDFSSMFFSELLMLWEEFYEI